MPVVRRKTVTNVLGLEYPTARATSRTERPSASSTSAAPVRARMRHWANDSPVSATNRRMKERGLMPTSDAQASSDRPSPGEASSRSATFSRSTSRGMRSSMLATGSGSICSTASACRLCRLASGMEAAVSCRSSSRSRALTGTPTTLSHRGATWSGLR